MSVSEYVILAVCMFSVNARVYGELVFLRVHFFFYLRHIITEIGCVFSLGKKIFSEQRKSQKKLFDEICVVLMVHHVTHMMYLTVDI